MQMMQTYFLWREIEANLILALPFTQTKISIFLFITKIVWPLTSVDKNLIPQALLFISDNYPMKHPWMIYAKIIAPKWYLKSLNSFSAALRGLTHLFSWFLILYNLAKIQLNPFSWNNINRIWWNLFISKFDITIVTIFFP